MNESHPIISVVIPAYNEERYLPACLASLKAQDFAGNFEIVVVDNNSNDRTAAIAAELGARVIFEPQQGVCPARQAGTEKALGQIVVSTDADTMYPTNWLSNIWDGFANDPEIVAVAGTCQWLNSPWWAKLYANTLFGIVQAMYKTTGQVKYITASNTAFRKKYWTGYNVNLAQGGDEFGLLAQLKDKGPIVFQRNNIALTSSRRLNQGLAYNIFVTSLTYYLFDYLIGRLFGKSLLGSYAPIRHDKVYNPRRTWAMRIAATIVMLLIGFSVATDNAMAARLIKKTRVHIGHFEDRFERHRK